METCITYINARDGSCASFTGLRVGLNLKVSVSTRMNTPPTAGLFETLPAVATGEYRNLRTPPSDKAARCREYCDRLWAGFHPYADADFVQDFPVHTHQRFWEMYLGNVLLDAGHHQLIAPKPGPDFGIELNGQRIWIEAVTATPGDPGKPDSVAQPAPGPGGIISGYVPQDQIVLRCSTAIHAKFPTQYNKHLQKGLIAPQDAYIIALNHSAAYYWVEVGTPPFVLRAVLGLGAHFVTLDRQSARITGSGIQYRGSIPKSSGALVDTNLFLSPESAPVSAVIGSVTSIGTPVNLQQGQHHDFGEDFRLIHNPHASNPLPQGVVVRGEEVRVKLYDDRFEVSGRQLPLPLL